MALFPCPDCQREMSDLAPSCPHCGRPRVPVSGARAQQARSGGGHGCLISVLVVIIGVILLAFLGSRSPQERAIDQAQGTPDGAAYICQEFVKDRLKAPATATFPYVHPPETTITTLGSGAYRVSSYVDAQNGFGAKIRTSYTCEVQKIQAGDRWKLRHLQM